MIEHRERKMDKMTDWMPPPRYKHWTTKINTLPFCPSLPTAEIVLRRTVWKECEGKLRALNSPPECCQAVRLERLAYFIRFIFSAVCVACSKGGCDIFFALSKYACVNLLMLYDKTLGSKFDSTILKETKFVLDRKLKRCVLKIYIHCVETWERKMPIPSAWAVVAGR